MWKFLKCLVTIIMIVSVSFGIYKLSNKYDMNLIYKDINWSINTKALEGATSFDFDKNNNLYIAFKDYIEIIDSNSKEEIIFSDKSFDIYDIACYKDELIIATDNRVVVLEIPGNKYKEIINNIPNNGMNNKTNLLIDNNDLYVTIGSNTNSGVVDDENRNEDKASFEWILSAIPYNKNYAFSSYGSIIKDSEKIEESILSNASIIRYNLKNGKLETYATGLRNIEGLASDSNKLIGIVGGMEDKGARPVKDDVDYIYEIKEKAWYGWPDFSGGDPITSPRFNDKDSQLSFVLKNHPTEIPMGPKYQHNNLSALKGLDIDKEGKCFPKGTIVFADNKENCIYVLTDTGMSKAIIALSKESYVEKIKFYQSVFYVLDSKVGCLYKIQSKSNSTVFNLPKEIFIFSILVITITSIVMIYKFKITKNKIK